MDLSILQLFIAFSIVLFIISRIVDGWKRLGLGWIAGGLMIIIGYGFANGETITKSIEVGTNLTKVTLDMGVSTENTFILFVLLGLVMIFSSSGDWI